MRKLAAPLLQGGGIVCSAFGIGQWSMGAALLFVGLSAVVLGVVRERADAG